MSGIKYYALRTGEEPPMEFVAIRHVDGEPEFVASYINTDYLGYQNGVLLKFHERNDKLRAENAKLREQMDWLVTLLRADCDIEASWDGLRKFWSIGLTEDGCLMRDRACKAEVENAKLRELARGLHMAYVETLNECESLNEGLIYEYSGSVKGDVAKSRAKFEADRHRFDSALRELGIEEE